MIPDSTLLSMMNTVNVPFDLNYRFGLIQDPAYVPSPADTLAVLQAAEFTNASWPGYATPAGGVSAAPFVNASHEAEEDFSPAIFTVTSAPPSAVAAQGWFAYDASLNVLLYAELFTGGPITVGTAGFSITLNPANFLKNP